MLLYYAGIMPDWLKTPFSDGLPVKPASIDKD
jgi:hypothetical protein